MSKQQVCVWHRDEVSMKLSSVTQTRNGSNTNSIPKIKTSFCKICWYVRDCVSNTSFVSFILWVRYEGWWDGSVQCVLENSLMLFCVWERNSLFLSLTFQKFVNSRLLLRLCLSCCSLSDYLVSFGFGGRSSCCSSLYFKINFAIHTKENLLLFTCHHKEHALMVEKTCMLQIET